MCIHIYLEICMYIRSEDVEKSWSDCAATPAPELIDARTTSKRENIQRGVRIHIFSTRRLGAGRMDTIASLSLRFTVM